MKIINAIGVVFALGLVLQFYFGVKNGYGLQNGIGSTLWIASIVGLGALLAANVYEIARTSGASLVTTGNKMRNAFFGAFATVGILLSIQSILLLNGSDSIFIPHWFLDLAWILLGLGAFAWIMLAGFYGITTGISRFQVWLAGNYKWLIFGGILLLLVSLAAFLISDGLTFKKEESLFKFKKEQLTEETADSTSTKTEPADQPEAADTTVKKNDEVEPDPDTYGEIIADNSGTTQIIIDGETKVIQKVNPEPQDEYPEQ